MSRYIDADTLKQKWLFRGKDGKPYRDEIDAMPTADVVEVKQGRWDVDSDNLPICSECGEIALQRVFIKLPHRIQDVRMVKSNYCPFCGARMVSE